MTRDDLSLMLSRCLVNSEGKTKDFILSLRVTFDQWGTLTPKQQSALSRINRQVADRLRSEGVTKRKR